MKSPAVQFGLKFLAVIMMVKALMIPVVYIDFKINQDYISRVLCINRDKPELKCNGHCVLMEKLKETQDTEQSPDNQANKKQNFETFCESLPDFQTRTFPSKSEKHRIYQILFLSHFSSDVFHPPKA